MQIINNIAIVVTMLALSGTAYGGSVPCGEPKSPSKPYKPHTISVWQDCKDLVWHLKAYKGRTKGTIYLSDLAVMYKDEVTGTKSSKLKLNNGEMKATIDFDILVTDANKTKEFSFAVPLYARMVLVMDPTTKSAVRYGNFLDSSGITNLINPPDVELHIIEIK